MKYIKNTSDSTCLKIDDFVIITKPITNHFNVKAQITDIAYRDDRVYFYQVKYKRNGINNLGVNNVGSCNIFVHSSDESIEIDVQYYRELKLKKLDI
jgi:predicted secreted protein